MTTIAHTAKVLREALVLINDPASSLNRSGKLEQAQHAMRAAVGFLEGMSPADPVNPERQLWAGEAFPVYSVHCTAEETDGVLTCDLAYAQAGAFGFGTEPSTTFFEDTLIDVLRSDAQRFNELFRTRDVQADEIDEDPPGKR